MLTQTAEYALRAVVCLAGVEPGEVKRATVLANELGVPANYLSKILHQLAAAGLLTSRRGRNGGFRLARPASRLTIAAVIEPFDGLAQYRSCLLGSAVCSDRTACEAHHRWKPLAASVLEFLHKTTVDSMVKTVRAPSSG